MKVVEYIKANAHAAIEIVNGIVVPEEFWDQD
jgi:hypothetical protein